MLNILSNRKIYFLLGDANLDTKPIGKRIQEARVAHNITQAQLAEMVNLSSKYLSNIECGAKSPSLESLIEIANALQIDANSLLVDVLDVAPAIISSKYAERLTNLPEIRQQRLMKVIDLFLEDNTQ